MNRRSFLAATAAGLAAGCAPDPEEVAERFPPEGRFVEIDGLKVHYREAGEGTPVILIHGANGNLRDWTYRPFGLLAERYRTIAFDRPGFGYTDRPEEEGFKPEVQAAILRSAAAELGVERPVVVGHSYGGSVAMAWALAAPEETRGVVSAAGATMPFGGVSSVYAAASAPVSGAIMAQAFNAWIDEETIRERVEGIFAPDPVPEGYVDHVGAPLSLRSATLQANAADLDHLNEALERMRPAYDGLAVPVEAVHGTADTTVGIDIHSRAMVDALPEARLTAVDGAGHMIHHAAFDALAAAIDRLAAA